jgi:hypothetical protein
MEFLVEKIEKFHKIIFDKCGDDKGTCGGKKASQGLTHV